MRLGRSPCTESRRFAEGNRENHVAGAIAARNLRKLVAASDVMVFAHAFRRIFVNCLPLPHPSRLGNPVYGPGWRAFW
jgi:hypothetical protein